MARGRGEVVMVAEANEQARREMMCDLRRAGYTPVGYPDIEGALAYLALGERLDALVTGVRPSNDRGAVDLAALAKAARPRLSVVYVSERHPGVDRMVPDGRFVTVPFRSGEVTDAVSERLATRQRRAA